VEPPVEEERDASATEAALVENIGADDNRRTADIDTWRARHRWIRDNTKTLPKHDRRNGGANTLAEVHIPTNLQRTVKRLP